ncbi:MAG: helicase [Acidobacteriota bacterium]|nr:helicase [Acidobacteriota bacterium]
MAVGTKEAKRSKSEEHETIFKAYSLGIKTSRDFIVYDFDGGRLMGKVRKFCEDYNAELFRVAQKGNVENIDKEVRYDKIKWSRNLKRDLQNAKRLTFDEARVRVGMYRPFTPKFLYFSDVIVDELGQNQGFLPDEQSEQENLLLCVGGYGRKVFAVFVTKHIPDLNFFADPQQSFPFYTYDEDGSNRRENVTDWALAQFRERYGDEKISKWDIFHYVYALLHHPEYRERYAANLKRELPRVPFAPDFRAFAAAGARLAEIHVNYERQPEYPLERVEHTDAPLDWRVERMRLSKDRTQIVYNNFLTLSGVPPEVYEYRLGNRSALEWVIDQYQLTTDRRSGITNDPNRPEDPQYILRLVAQVVNVSLETVKLVRELPELGLQTEG